MTPATLAKWYEDTIIIRRALCTTTTSCGLQYAVAVVSEVRRIIYSVEVFYEIEPEPLVLGDSIIEISVREETVLRVPVSKCLHRRASGGYILPIPVHIERGRSWQLTLTEEPPADFRILLSGFTKEAA